MMPEIARPIWEIRPQADDFIFRLFAECVADLADPLNRIDDLFAAQMLTSHALRKAARDMSVAIRKLMIDNNGHLFKTCVHQPSLHHLKRPPNADVSDLFSENINGMRIHYRIAGSDQPQTFKGPGYEHQTVVHALYGLVRVGCKRYRLGELFDFSRRTEKVNRWMNHRVMQVDGQVLKARDLLHILAVKEGSHVELDEMTRLAMSAPVDLKIADKRGEMYRKANLITLSGVSYLHVFTILVANYLVNMMKVTLVHLPERRRRLISYISDTLLNSPSRLPSIELTLEKQFGICIVLKNKGSENDPIEPVGNYDAPGLTQVQIPD